MSRLRQVQVCLVGKILRREAPRPRALYPRPRRAEPV